MIVNIIVIIIQYHLSIALRVRAALLLLAVWNSPKISVSAFPKEILLLISNDTRLSPRQQGWMSNHCCVFVFVSLLFVFAVSIQRQHKYHNDNEAWFRFDNSNASPQLEYIFRSSPKSSKHSMCIDTKCSSYRRVCNFRCILPNSIQSRCSNSTLQTFPLT